MRELSQVDRVRGFSLVYHQHFSSPATDVMLCPASAGGSGGVALRVTRGPLVAEYGPEDLLPSGIPARDAVIAWVRPSERRRLVAMGFQVASFTDPCAADELLAAEFLGLGGGGEARGA